MIFSPGAQGYTTVYMALEALAHSIYVFKKVVFKKDKIACKVNANGWSVVTLTTGHGSKLWNGLCRASHSGLCAKL